jgi:hypothetical protein
LRAYQEWEAGGGIQWANAKKLAKVLGTLADYIMSGAMSNDLQPSPSMFAMGNGGGQLDRIEQKLDVLVDEINRLRAEATIRDAEAQRRIEALEAPSQATRQQPRR